MKKLITVCAVIAISVRLTADDLPIIAHWSFNEDHGKTMLMDSGPNKINVSLVPAEAGEKVKTVEGVIGQALELTGEEDAVYNSNNAHLKNLKVPFTIACWINLKSKKEANNSILVNAWDTNKAGYRLFVSWNRAFFRWGDGNKMNSLATTNGSILLNRWYHLAVTNDGKTIKIYVNGSMNASVEGDDLQHAPNNAPVCIGSYFRTKNYRFIGLLDELCIFGKALSDDEVFELAAKR